MSNLLDDRIGFPAVAYGAEPYSVAEIDAHPDRARIWATIRVMREEHHGTEGAQERAYQSGYEGGYDAAKREFCNDD